MHISKWLIATAGLLFVVLIASVAFLIGRQTVQPQEAPLAVAEASGGAVTPPITASTSGTAPTAAAPPSTASASLSSTSAPAAGTDTSQATAEARARVSASRSIFVTQRLSRELGDSPRDDHGRHYDPQTPE